MNNPGLDYDGPAPPGEDLAALRENLLEQRRFRREQLRQITADAQYAPSGEAPGPRAAESEASPGMREVQLKLAASARMVLDDVEAALERMRQGRYGRCHRCTLPIDPARLAIVPQARYCAHCQQLRETGR